jgi:hypothetical protein
MCVCVCVCVYIYTYIYVYIYIYIYAYLCVYLYICQCICWRKQIQLLCLLLEMMNLPYIFPVLSTFISLSLKRYRWFRWHPLSHMNVLNEAWECGPKKGLLKASYSCFRLLSLLKGGSFQFSIFLPCPGLQLLKPVCPTQFLLSSWDPTASHESDIFSEGLGRRKKQAQYWTSPSCPPQGDL